MQRQHLPSRKEELIQEIEQLRTSNELKNGWISMISHHFKGTFSSMVMLIDALENDSISRTDFIDLLPQLKSDAEKNIKLISEAGVWMKTLQEDYEMVYEELVFREVYDQLKDKFHRGLEDKKVKLNFVGEDNLRLISDRFLLTFILERLLDNAIKYSHSGQTVHIRAENTDHSTRVTVADRGVGMSAQILPSIFSFDGPVYQGTRGEMGLGLSLKIVKSFVSLLAGKIEFASSVGEGTEVNIYLPLSKN